MATITIMKCDICGTETNNAKTAWHSMTQKIVIKAPVDGTNGGDWSGDWCVGCRIKLDNFLQDMKYKHGQVDTQPRGGE